MIRRLAQLHQLASGERVNLPFHLLDVDRDFLRGDPAEWPNDSRFQKLEQFVRHFRVTNECAERAVQLASTFNGKITKDEKQHHYLFSTVTQQRRDRSSLSRKSMK